MFDVRGLMFDLKANRNRKGNGNKIAGRGDRISDSRRVRYPWAMAPTINTTKLVATAIATFASTDKFIIFPSIMAATPMPPPFLNFSFFDRFEFQRADGCQAQCEENEELSDCEKRHRTRRDRESRG